MKSVSAKTEVDILEESELNDNISGTDDDDDNKKDENNFLLLYYSIDYQLFITFEIQIL